MSKLFILRGLPACGKSTRAQEMITRSGNTVRLNKDLMRTMLHFDRWTGRNESLTGLAMHALAKALLGHVNVIVDDTNLNPKVLDGWKRLAVERGAKSEVVDMTDVPQEVCIERDRNREKSVGYTVIRNMALRYGLHRFQQAEVVICDIDGTIADIAHRLHHVKETEKKDWKAFYAGIMLDRVRHEVQARLQEHILGGRTVVFVSGRPDRYKTDTLDWLSWTKIPHFTVLMRRSDDHRPDEEVKHEIVLQHFPDLSVIHSVLDDRPRVIRMWLELGLTVEDVGAGVEF